jgi:hypothetical protein
MNNQKLLTNKAPRHQEKQSIGFKKSSFLPSLVTWCLGGSILFSAVAGCSRGKTDIPGLSDEPLTAPVTLKDLPETVPASGIVAGGTLEVSIEKEDAPRVAPGQAAMVFVGASQAPVECRVANILLNANLATGMAIAWLRPMAKTALPAGDFVSAQVILRVKRHVATVPHQAVFVRDGKTMVIVKQPGEKEGESQYEPVEVGTGIASDKDVEILSGLKPGDQVVVKAGIGYLYPEFQSEAGD